MSQVNQNNMTDAPYLSPLNPEQRAAVEALDGPVLVLAGAGTGKTRVLTTRLGHLLATRKAFPGEIFTVTFTNKAALEMKERVAKLINHPVDGWWLGTFHSLAARMLRRHAELVGLKSNFTILDTDDQLRLIKQILAEANIDAKKWTPRVILGFIERWKDKGLTPSDINPKEGSHIADGALPRLYKTYQGRLKTLNACDFGDLLLHIITIFKNPEHKLILADYHRRFKYILVDEYQDTNTAQYLWLRLLAQSHKNICCVGDDDQSIYGWRGAEVENILKFETDFPGAKIVRLEQNYRSTQNILSAANSVISHNTSRLGKNLWSAHEEGDKIQLHAVWDGRKEALKISEEVENLQRKGASLNDIAVLVRAGSQTREFEERFMAESIPYKVIGGPRFYERMEIRDALAYLRVLVQPSDDLALERIINKPKRGLGPATLNILHAFARAKDISLSNTIHHVTQTDELRPKPKSTLIKVMDDFERWRSLTSEMKHAELAQMILEESGYIQMWKDDKTPEAPGRLENITELLSALNEFETLNEFLEHVSLVMGIQNQNDTDMVTIMTLHSAKGLEFDTVFLPGWEEGIFPNQRSLDETGLAGLEEERRLAYVGITRARKKAYIFHAANRQLYGKWLNCIPSRFIEELPEKHVDFHSDVGLYGSGFAGRQDDHGFQNQGHRGQSAPLKTHSSAGIGSGLSRLKSQAGFEVNQRIFHQKFGYGKIISVDGDKLDIRFEKTGRKKVLDSFVKPSQAV